MWGRREERKRGGGIGRVRRTEKKQRCRKRKERVEERLSQQPTNQQGSLGNLASPGTENYFAERITETCITGGRLLCVKVKVSL